MNGLGFIPFILIVPVFFFLVPIVMGVWVYKDAERRGMNGLVWALIVTFVPSLIGLIIYFVVRENEGGFECGNCHATVKSNQDYCPNCGSNLQSRYDIDEDRSQGEGRIPREGRASKIGPVVLVILILAFVLLFAFLLFGIFSFRSLSFPGEMRFN